MANVTVTDESVVNVFVRETEREWQQGRDSWVQLDNDAMAQNITLQILTPQQPVMMKLAENHRTQDSQQVSKQLSFFESWDKPVRSLLYFQLVWLSFYIGTSRNDASWLAAVGHN